MKKKLGQITDCLISYILLRTREKYKKEKHHDKPYSLNEYSAASSTDRPYFGPLYLTLSLTAISH